MKTFNKVFRLVIVVFLYGTLFISCGSDEPDEVEQPKIPSDTLKIQDLDDLSDHLQFFNATKKEGKAPAAAGATSMKFSIRDTLRLLEGSLRPIKFLHDESTNVEAAYIQVSEHFVGGSGGIFAANYYDVPEISNTADSDTVSIIMVGFDPVGFELPLSFEITITLIGPGGQPIDEMVVPVIVEDLNDQNNSSGECGLVLPEGEYWDWILSFVLDTDSDGDFDFWAEPNTVFGGQQIIKGCCIDGVSDYGQACLLGDPAQVLANERSLPFASSYQIVFESFIFLSDGKFRRFTLEDAVNPLPNVSDFCAGGQGIVVENLSLITYLGNWTVTPVNLPQSFPSLSRNNLSFQGTSSSPQGGYGNSGGIIHDLGCIGLVLIQIDREGGNHHLFKFYERRKEGDERWYAIHK